MPYLVRHASIANGSLLFVREGAGLGDVVALQPYQLILKSLLQSSLDFRSSSYFASWRRFSYLTYATVQENSVAQSVHCALKSCLGWLRATVSGPGRDCNGR